MTNFFPSDTKGNLSWTCQREKGRLNLRLVMCGRVNLRVATSTDMEPTRVQTFRSSDTRVTLSMVNSRVLVLAGDTLVFAHFKMF